MGHLPKRSLDEVMQQLEEDGWDASDSSDESDSPMFRDKTDSDNAMFLSLIAGSDIGRVIMKTLTAAIGSGLSFSSAQIMCTASMGLSGSGFPHEITIQNSSCGSWDIDRIAGLPLSLPLVLQKKMQMKKAAAARESG